MLYLLVLAGSISILIPFGIGLLTIIQWIKPQPGIDSSNVINRIRLWWFAQTRPDIFVPVCPWLLNDEYENVSDKEPPSFV